jgi:hypothetical protein
MQQGLQLHQAGQLQDAEQTFRRVRAAAVVKNVVPGLKIAFKKPTAAPSIMPSGFL